MYTDSGESVRHASGAWGAAAIAATVLSTGVLPDCFRDDGLVVSLEDGLVPAALDTATVAVGTEVVIEHICATSAATTAAATVATAVDFNLAAFLRAGLNVVQLVLVGVDVYSS